MGFKKLELCFHILVCTLLYVYRICCNVDVYYLPLIHACTCQHQRPKTTPTRSKLAWSTGACQCPFLSQQQVHCLNRATERHSSSFSLSRGATVLLITENDPSVWHAQDPEPPRIGVRVQIPIPEGRTGIPANDSEIQRVDALVIWTTEPLHQLSCAVSYFLADPTNSLCVLFFPHLLLSLYNNVCVAAH